MITSLWRVKKKNELISLKTRCVNSSYRRPFCTTPSDLKEQVELAAKRLNVKHMSDWYSKAKKDFAGFIDEEIYKTYDSSYQLLSAAYPDYEWLPWKFASPPRSYWSDTINQQKFIKYFANQMKISNMDDWYNVTIKDFLTHGGNGLLDKYGYSVPELLSKMFPQVHWKPWLFRKTMDGHWKDVNNQQEFMRYAEKALNIKEMSDWYNVSAQEFKRIGGVGLYNEYNRMFYNMISKMYPNYEWLPWKFLSCYHGWWDTIENQRKFVDWAGKQLGIKEMSDWYKVPQNDLFALGGTSLLNRYKGSPALLLPAVYPEYDWLPWKFFKTPKNFWNDDKNKIKFVLCLEKELNIKNPDDWYNVTIGDLRKHGGGTLLYHDITLPKLLALAYPDHKWEAYRFANVSQETVLDLENKVNFVKYVERELGISQVEDWKYVMATSIQKLNLPPRWGLPEVLALVREVHKNDDITSRVHKSQKALKVALEKIFPKEEMLEEYKHEKFHSVKGKPLEFDFYFPKISLAFEYQGIQHYRKQMNFLHNQSSFDERKQNDINKLQLCKDAGITLIEVPFWWDKRISSLKATIYNNKPNLFKTPPAGSPISASPPAETNTVKLGLMTASVWNEETMEPNGWWMTEKYDGMRLYWSGTQFFTRLGTKMKVPDSIKSKLPNVALDGELWTQYGLYQDAVNLSMTQSTEKWEKAVFWVFDAPNIDDKPFEERIDYLNKLKEEGKLPSFVKIVETVKCKDKEHLKEYLNSILAKGGEGVMLREPQSLYKTGRSPSLRKYKPFSDTEVKVIENNYPHGFDCEQPNGKRIFVGLSDNYLEAKKVQKGAIITVKHQGANMYGTLQYPKFYRERNDVNWHDLIKTQ